MKCYFVLVLALWAVAARANDPCRILSLSGGGSLGATESGVISNLVHNHQRSWDVYTGVSAGGLNAAWLGSYAKGDESNGADQLKDLWVKVKSKNIYKDQLFWKQSIYSTEPMREWLTNEIKGKQVVRPVLIGTSSYATGGIYMWTEDEIRTEQDLLNTMMSTSAIPVLFPPVLLNNTLYGDGGILSNEIIAEGIRRCPAGSNVEIDLVLCVPNVGVRNNTKDWGIIDIAVRSLEVNLFNIFNHALDDRCAPGVTSNVKVNVWRANLLEDVAAMNFDMGELLWKIGYSLEMAESVYFCYNE